MADYMNVWEKLIDHAVNGTKPRSFDVNMTVQVDDETWCAYSAEVAHRDILFYCKEGTATFLVDTYGDRHTVECWDWQKV